MSKLLIICAVTGLWLSAAGIEQANAKGGTFRLEGPWPSSSTETRPASVGVSAAYNDEPECRELFGKHRQSQAVLR